MATYAPPPTLLNPAPVSAMGASRKGGKRDAITRQRKDDAVLMLIKGLNFLTAQAQAAGLGTAARILDTAHEDMVYWAAERNLNETRQEQFIYRQLYDSGLFPAAEFALKIAAIEDPDLRGQIAGLLGLPD